MLPQPEGEPVKLVVPTSLQMGWIDSPPCFCAASETRWDAAAQYIETPVGSLDEHKFFRHTNGGKEYANLPRSGQAGEGFSYMLAVYVDDYIALAVPTTQDQLGHVANGVLTGIQDVIPKDNEDDNNPISLKKLKKLEES